MPKVVNFWGGILNMFIVPLGGVIYILDIPYSHIMMIYKSIENDIEI